MRPPRHLWRGDWRADSRRAAEAAEEQAAARRAAAQAEAPAGRPEEDASERPNRTYRTLAIGGVCAGLLGLAFAIGVLVERDDGPETLPAVSSAPIKPGKGKTRASAIYAAASPAVVSVRTTSGSGTGFLIGNDGKVVTNAHVVENSKRVTVRFGEDQSHPADVLGTDPSSDLAVLSIDSADLPRHVKPLRFADSSTVSVGDVAIAIGNPFGLDRTATEGIVSGIGRHIAAPNGYSIDEVIQTDAPINPGNSGGPLLDDSGAVIGVNAQIATGGTQGNIGIGFAVPSNTARQVVPRLARGEQITRAYLGLETSPASPGADVGAEVQRAVPGGPGSRAGIQVGDVILKLDGKDVNEPSDVSAAIADKRPGDEVEIEVERGGRLTKVKATLGKRPSPHAMSFAEPLALLALLALPLLVVLYLKNERRRAAAASAFAAPALLGSVAPVRPRWRRHVPMAVLGLALAALIFAAARPQRTVAVPVERASIVLATDVSGSMLAIDVAPNRLVAVKRAARRFVEQVPARVRVGILAFNHRPRLLQSPTTDRLAVDEAIDGLEPSGGTAVGDAIQAADAAVRGPARRRRTPAAIVLLSDGKSSRGIDAVAAARASRRLRIPVYTVTLGTDAGTITVPAPGGGSTVKPVPPDPRSLERVAEASGGEAFTAETASGLKKVYERLGSQLSHRDEQRQVTSAFAGGGLLLLLGAAAASLRWFGRII